MDVVCTPGERSCEGGPGGQLQVCNEGGTLLSSSDCPSSRFCDDSASVAQCSPDICRATHPGCDHESLATCDAWGSGFIDGTSDCAASNMVCTFAGCAAEDVLTTPGGQTFYEGSPRLFLTRIFVTTTRRLAEIEHFGSVTGNVTFTWLAYEGAQDPDGTMSKVLTKQTTLSGTNQFFSSGGIDVTLEAGRYYLVGVYVGSGSTFGYGSGSTHYGSFGIVKGGTQFRSGGVPDAASGGWVNPGIPIYQRFTTVLGN